jgi:hypothetical protein
MVRPALAALAMLALAWPAPAQGALSITEVRAPQEPLQPIVEIGLVEVAIVVDCSSVFARAPPPSVPEGVQVTFEASQDVVITGASMQPLSSDACPTPTGNVTLVAPFQVVVLREAVGLRPLGLVAHAMLLGDPLVPDPAEDSAQFTVTPGPFLAYQAQVDTKLKGCGCPVVFDVAVTNLGNVPTTFSFELAMAPAAGNVTLPAPFTLEPSTVGSTSVGTGKIVFEGPPGDWPGEVVLSVAVKGAAAADPGSVGTPVSVSMLVRNQAGQAKDVPMPDPTALALVLLGLAVAAARRRA